MATTKKTTKSTKTSPKTTKVSTNGGSLSASLQRHTNDTWSPEVQVARLTDEITVLQAHLQLHSKDADAKRSLLKKVAKRRTFLKFLKSSNLERYSVASKKLGLKA